MNNRQQLHQSPAHERTTGTARTAFHSVFTPSVLSLVQICEMLVRQKKHSAVVCCWFFVAFSHRRKLSLRCARCGRGKERCEPRRCRAARLSPPSICRHAAARPDIELRSVTTGASLAFVPETASPFRLSGGGRTKPRAVHPLFGANVMPTIVAPGLSFHSPFSCTDQRSFSLMFTRSARHGVINEEWQKEK